MQTSTADFWLGSPFDEAKLLGWNQSIDRVSVYRNDNPQRVIIHIGNETVTFNSQLTTVWATKGRLREVQVLPLRSRCSLEKAKECAVSIADMLDSKKLCEMRPVVDSKLKSASDSDYSVGCVSRHNGNEIRIELKRVDASDWIVIVEFGVLNLYRISE